MPETEVVRQFFRDVADHIEGTRPLPDPETAVEILRMIANSKKAKDGGWKQKQKKKKGK